MSSDDWQVSLAWDEGFPSSRMPEATATALPRVSLRTVAQVPSARSPRRIWLSFLSTEGSQYRRYAAAQRMTLNHLWCIHNAATGCSLRIRATFRITIATNCWQISPRATEHRDSVTMPWQAESQTERVPASRAAIMNPNPPPALTAMADFTLPATYVRPCRAARVHKPFRGCASWPVLHCRILRLILIIVRTHPQPLPFTIVACGQRVWRLRRLCTEIELNRWAHRHSGKNLVLQYLTIWDWESGL